MSYAQDWSLISQILTSQDISRDELSKECKEVLSKYGYMTYSRVSQSGNEYRIFCYHKSKDSFVKISWNHEDNYSWNVGVKVYVTLNDGYAIDNLAKSVPNEEFSKDDDSPWYYRFSAKPNKGIMSQYSNFGGVTRKENNDNNHYYTMYAAIKW